MEKSTLKDYLTESLDKEHCYRIKLAYDCDEEFLSLIEKCLEKYNLVSIVPFDRVPITKNPVEFTRVKGKSFVSEVCSTDVVLKYPVNDRLLQVWLASNLNLDPDRILCYGVEEPRQLHAAMAEIKADQDIDRYPNPDDAFLINDEDMPISAEAMPEILYGEEHNKKFIADILKMKQEKGNEYFANHAPSKDKIMGNDLSSIFHIMLGKPNMGRSTAYSKEADVLSQTMGNSS